MSMHLLSHSFTSLNTKKAKIRLTKAKLEQYKKDLISYNKENKKTGQAPVDLDYYIKLRHGKIKAEQKFTTFTASPGDPLRLNRMAEFRNKYKSLNSMQGNTSRQEPLKYDGERKLIGIATMHKSNLVPVFDEESARDLATMRRN